MERQDLVQLNPSLWEIPKSYRSDMRAPARLYADESQLAAILADTSLEQLVNVTTLPGIEPYALAMPDIHQGYGFPIGGVAPIRADTGVISPGGVGYDINCGVRLLCADLDFGAAKKQLKKLMDSLYRAIPSGVGKPGPVPLGMKEFDIVLNQGCRWALQSGYAAEADLEVIEEHGSYHHADAQAVSPEAKKRGAGQLGTIGSGNHFVEVQTVERVVDPEIAAVYGLEENRIVVLIHTGSRGLGHQICTDYVRLMNTVLDKYGLVLPDRELACAPFRSPEGQRYFKAMAAAANFAWTNRQLITHAVRRCFGEIFDLDPTRDVKLLYDVSHNIAKLEEHGGAEFIVHRKGATRSFGPGSPDIPERYKSVGQPVLIPGSMGTASYVLAGAEQGMSEGFGSCCHGAGRQLSRTKAAKTIDHAELSSRLEHFGVTVRAGSRKGLLEEAPEAYKDVDQVVSVVQRGALAKIVARLRPIGVLKG